MGVGKGFNIGTELKPGEMLPWAEAPYRGIARAIHEGCSTPESVLELARP
jgi:hypothetical protein